MTKNSQSMLQFPSVKPPGEGRPPKAPGKQASAPKVTANQGAGPTVEQPTTASGRPKRQSVAAKELAKRERLFDDDMDVEEEQPARRVTKRAEAPLPQAKPPPMPAVVATRTSSRISNSASEASVAYSSRRQAADQHATSKDLQASSTAVKAAKRTHGAAGTKSKQGSREAVKFFDRYEIHGAEYKVGDAVYVIRTADQNQWPDDEAEDVCVVCDKGHKSHTILECDRCLAGFHMGCLRPPLKAVPKGSWVCDGCTRGEAPGANRKLRTAYEKFLFVPKSQEVIALGVISGFIKNRQGDGELEIAFKYFTRPEDTHTGRQPHHGSREVLLTTTEHYEPAEAIWGRATVCSLQEFEEHEGTDVFYCEFEYDETWKQFRRTTYNRHSLRRRVGRGGNVVAATKHSDDDQGVSEDEEGDDSDSDFDGRNEGVGSDDEEYVRDRTFKPIYAFWAERGMLPPTGSGATRGRGAPSRRGGALNRKRVGLLPAHSEDQGGCQLLELSGGGGMTSQPVPSQANALVVARKALATAAPPATLPCRDTEKSSLTNFMRAAINEEGGSGPGVLYVCGVPGTGKTACINEVLGALRPQAQSKGVQVVFVNALSLPSPTHVYSKLWEKLTGQHLGPARALAALEATFSTDGTHMMVAGPSSSSGTIAAVNKAGKGRRPCMTLLVVDEIDVLMTKGQAVLYNLFEWPVRPGARLAVIGISNTHDFDDRVLPRISSRLASSKLAFSAYNKDQLVEITRQRLKAAGCEILIKEAGVQLAVRKVASSSGDVRRALELLRRALEVAEAERREANLPMLTPGHPMSKDCVTEKHVMVASNEMFSSPHMQFLSACSRLEKLALVALLMEMRATNKPEATVQAIHDRMCSHVALLIPDARVEPVTLCRVLFEMAAKRLLVTSPTWQALKARVALNVHKDDVCHAVKADRTLQDIHGQLA